MKGVQRKCNRGSELRGQGSVNEGSVTKQASRRKRHKGSVLKGVLLWEGHEGRVTKRGSRRERHEGSGKKGALQRERNEGSVTKGA